jgi:hypothetical protein
MPDDDEQVRRLLADARHAGPVPEDVADRLDRVLADLRDGSDGAVRTTAPPADLAAARRRHRARTWLVAAAALVAVAVGVDRFGLPSAGDHGSDTSSAGSAETGADGQEGAGAAADGSPGLSGGAGAPAPLSADRFTDQVRRLRTRAVAPAERGLVAGSAAPSESGRRLFPPGTCPTRRWGAGTVVPVRYGGTPGGLVYRSPRGDTQVVDLFLCGHDEPTRSVTLRAP